MPLQTPLNGPSACALVSALAKLFWKCPIATQSLSYMWQCLGAKMSQQECNAVRACALRCMGGCLKAHSDAAMLDFQMLKNQFSIFPDANFFFPHFKHFVQGLKNDILKELFDTQAFSSLRWPLAPHWGACSAWRSMRRSRAPAAPCTSPCRPMPCAPHAALRVA